MHSPGKKSIFLYAKIDGCLKKDSQPQGYVRFCSNFFLNVPRSRINKVRRTEFIFRSQFDLFLSSKIKFDFSTMVFRIFSREKRSKLSQK